MLIGAYYLRAHTYTFVPRHIREDMEWMAGVGTKAVVLGILEQDLYAAISNVRLICEEAARAGMEVWAVPCRWGGLVAGAPKVPSYFTSVHPETWILDKEGKMLECCIGPSSSVHHPATLEFVVHSADSMLRIWPIKGIIWDEVKILDRMDYCPAARQALGDRIDDFDAHTDAAAEFFNRANVAIRRRHPDVALAMFIYGHFTGHLVEAPAAIETLDYFGCDGSPWFTGESEDREKLKKMLLDEGLRFLDAARRHNKKTLWLIENHDLVDVDVDLMDRRLPEVLAYKPDLLLYYYYGRNSESPDRNMSVLGKHLRSVS